MTHSIPLPENVRDVDALARHLSLTKEQKEKMAAILQRYPMSITPYYLSLINFDDPSDPILKMAVPSAEETDLSGSFDTSGEAGNTVIPGLQHKYTETTLLLSNSECAMYCRHCFRKRLVGLSGDEVGQNFGAIHEYISRHTEISNVLVSGGDALMNTNQRLLHILSTLADIPHLDFLRVCTRVPVVHPARVTGDAELLSGLAALGQKKQLVLATQFNHPREVSAEAAAAVRALQTAGLVVRNQAVLLKGVNDDAATLGTLMKKLTAIGVQPYYVFQCRPVTGVKQQFQVPLRLGCQVVEKAKAMQNGIGKGFKYCLSHVSGKLEILGASGGNMLFKYHEAKDKAMLGRLLSLPVDDEQSWLDDPAP